MTLWLFRSGKLVDIFLKIKEINLSQKKKKQPPKKTPESIFGDDKSLAFKQKLEF